MKALILGSTETVLVDAPLEGCIRRLAAWADGPTCPFIAHHRSAHFQFAPRPTERRVWSPHLTIDVREAPTAVPSPSMPIGPDAPTPVTPTPVAPTDAAPGDGPRTEVFGRFNPSPAIWTGYMLSTLALLTIIVSALVWGGAQLQIEQTPTAWWAVPGAVVILVAMWSANAVGQHLARDQVAVMWAAIKCALGDAERDAEEATEPPGDAPGGAPGGLGGRSPGGGPDQHEPQIRYFSAPLALDPPRGDNLQPQSP